MCTKRNERGNGTQVERVRCLKAEWNMKVIRRRRDGNSKGSQEKMTQQMMVQNIRMINPVNRRKVYY